MAKVWRTIPIILIASTSVGCTFSTVATNQSMPLMVPTASNAIKLPSNQRIGEPAFEVAKNHCSIVGGAFQVAGQNEKSKFDHDVDFDKVEQVDGVREIESIEVVDPLVEFSDPDLTLEGLVNHALSNNPSVRQAEAAVCKARGIQTQVGLKPNPSIGYFGEEIGADESGGLHGIYLSQTFVRGNKLSWNRHVLSHDVNQLKWQLQTQRKRVENDVKIQFYRVLTAQRKLSQAREFRKNAEKAVDIAKQRLDSEDGTKPDLLQSEVLLDQIELSIQAAEIELNAAWSVLAALVGDPEMQQSDLVGDLAIKKHLAPDVMWTELESTSPLLMAAMARVDRARTNFQRQKNQAIPNINGQIAAGYDDGSGNAFSSLQLEMPIPYYNRNQGNLSAAHAEYNLSLRNLERLRILMRKNLATATGRYEQCKATVIKLETQILPKSKESLELVERAYSAGEVDFLRVLSSRQSYFQLTQKFVDSLGQLAQIDAEIGGLLLTGGLENGVTFTGDDSLRGQALNGQ